jgi:parallel beta-helix repeat protein
MLLGCAVALLLLLALAAWGIETSGWAPRAVGPYIEQRASGHNPTIQAVGRWVGRTLVQLDRGVDAGPSDLHLRAGAQQGETLPSGAGALMVDSADGLRRAIAKAEPGNVITLLPGTYRFQGAPIDANRAGQAGAPVIVRAARLGAATIEFATVEGFRVSAPYWRFENLSIRGTCPADHDCEHAFHVVGGAQHFESVNNLIIDFNAHIKVNAQDGRFPDNGLVEHTTLSATHPRATVRPVTPFDLVTASNWILRDNLISDFAKSEGNRVSYGAFVKGGGSNNLFERNVVWCEQHLRGLPGQRIGLSLGGGGTGPKLCRDGRCITEQDGSVLRANLVVGCSDVGIYLNSAAGSKILDNTLVDTAGIDVRYPTSSALIDGNIVDGRIRSREGGIVHATDNLSASLLGSYLGMNTVRTLFRAPEDGDFAWRDGPPLRTSIDRVDSAKNALDLCGKSRPAMPVYGAFSNFGDCLAAPR